MFKSDKRLYTLAMKFNREFFDGSLPSDLIVGWEDELQGCNDYGVMISLENDETKQVTFRVSVNSAWKKSYEISRLTLLHELCHVKLYPCVNHGRKFQEEMYRIAGRGAFKNLW